MIEFVRSRIADVPFGLGIAQKAKVLSEKVTPQSSSHPTAEEMLAVDEAVFVFFILERNGVSKWKIWIMSVSEEEFFKNKI